MYGTMLLLGAVERKQILTLLLSIRLSLKYDLPLARTSWLAKVVCRLPASCVQTADDAK